MKRIINVLLALVCMLALLASVTPKTMITDNLTQNNEVAKVSFKIPLPVDVNTSVNYANSETVHSEYVVSEK